MQKKSNHNDEVIESVTLSINERKEMRAGLLRFIEMYSQSAFQYGLRSFITIMRPFYGIMSLAVIMMFIVGGISYAAESALPGDILYPVKVSGTERFLSWTAVSYEASGSWQVSRAERRLQEATLLAVQGKLDAAKEAELSSRLKQHTEEASESIAHLQIDKQITAAANTSSRLESSLRIHEQILTHVAEDKTELNGPILGMLAIIREDVQETRKVRASIEEEIIGDKAKTTESITGAASKKAKQLEKSLTNAYKYIKTDAFDEVSRGKAESLLLIAKEISVDGDNFLKEEEYGKAFTSYQKALRIADTVLTYSDAKTGFAIELSLEAIIGESIKTSASQLLPKSDLGQKGVTGE